MTKTRTDKDDLRTIKHLVIVSLVVALSIGLFFYLWTKDSTDTLKKADADIIATRTESRGVACRNSRNFQLEHNGLVRNTQKLVREAYTASAAMKSTQAERNETLAFMNARLAEFEENIVDVIDCSTPEAIERNYQERHQ